MGQNVTILFNRTRDVRLSVERDRILWEPITGENVTYDVVQGSLNALRSSAGNLFASTTVCLAEESTGTSEPLDGMLAAGEGVWFLVREGGGDPGTYDSGSFHQAADRDAGIDGSATGCF